jgi:hypothetical protein
MGIGTAINVVIDLRVALLILLALVLIGFVSTIWDLIVGIQDLLFTHDYRDRYRQLLNGMSQKKRGVGFDPELYEWLMERVDRMQVELGIIGIMEHYRPPFENFAYKQYPILVNTLPQIRGRGGAHPNDLSMCDDLMTRHIGRARQKIRSELLRLINPLALLAEGTKFVVTLPLLLAYYSGLLKYGTYARASGSRFTGFIIFVLTAGASIVTIVVGWDKFVEIVRGLLAR